MSLRAGHNQRSFEAGTPPLTTVLSVPVSVCAPRSGKQKVKLSRRREIRLRRIIEAAQACTKYNRVPFMADSLFAKRQYHMENTGQLLYHHLQQQHIGSKTSGSDHKHLRERSINLPVNRLMYWSSWDCPQQSSCDGRIQNFLSAKKQYIGNNDITQRIPWELADYPADALQDLLNAEMRYHPSVNFLYYVNSTTEDKVNAAIRNEAVFSLRFLHNGFFTLSADTFCKAVNLIDRFIAKVKVKPKYMSCVATACYYIASKICEPNMESPSPDTLVQIAHCGGTTIDLLRMEQILVSKLGSDLSGVTALDFLRVFITGSEVIGQDMFSNIDLPVDLTLQLQIALCSLEVYRYRSSCLALGILLRAARTSAVGTLEISKLENLAELCKVGWSEVCGCADLVQELCDAFYNQPLPCSRRQLVWNLSRRTLSRIACSSPTPLDTISEDIENAEDDEFLLQLLFDSANN